ncbi:DsbA family oxidoreductase [Cochlodiniinecator piscidefendens]|uniref:DsbA family oxidoreductase n=1 Tax=Cochlodiniinecator piscidefendens TaxID=2715756 RepID=UPI001408AE8C|nr:DsbA family oxidoreductase [Cochlodiniinecator piscidefendens]
MVKLDILSDPICPWCYIGKTYLDRALEAHPEHDFLIEWHPFQLNHNMPEGGMDRRQYLETKFGGQKGAIQAYMPVVENAKEAGLSINFEGIETTPNTLNAHRVIHWAGLEGKQTPMVSAMFKAYFTEGLDIGDAEVLNRLAEGIGMEAGLVARLLATDEDKQLMHDRDAHARERGVRSVPTFIVNNQYAISGAQKPDMWANVIAEIAQSQQDEDTDE